MRADVLAVLLLLAGLAAPLARPAHAASGEQTARPSATTASDSEGDCPVTAVVMGRTLNATLGEESCISRKKTDRFLVDRYRFTGSKGQRVIIVTEARKRTFRPSVSLIREDGGRRVARAGPIGSVTRLPTGKWPLKLPSAGDYLIEVTSLAPEGRGRYTLKVGNACGDAAEGAKCNDGNRCTYDTCDLDGICIHPPNDTAPCDDGDACTMGDICSHGRCIPGQLAHCDDGNECTDDGCEAASGCVYTNNTGACDDDNACTVGDTCKAGRCRGGPPARCDDDNICTDDACDPATGCVHAPNSRPCEDHNACTFNDTCTDGACLGGPAANCDDGNACTDDDCDPDSGCVYTSNTGACDDGNACTTGDTCADGRCTSGPPADCDDGNPCTDDTCARATGCVHRANSAACDDGDLCTREDRCAEGRCTGGQPVACEAEDTCHEQGVCDPATGTCSSPPVPDGTACDDGDACTREDTCAGGRCAGGIRLDCDDGDPCTDDACSTKTGCTHSANTAPCDDGDACTVDDVCAEGRCNGGPRLDCDDGNVCTDDTCDRAAGCVHTANTARCDDGNACTREDTCANGRCRGQEDLDCDDGNPCTDDTCDPATGCVHRNNAVACDDGNACTVNDACTNGRCAGRAPVACDDGNPCTDDTCDPATGCINRPNRATCDDSDLCTRRDVCVDGRCTGLDPVTCIAPDECLAAGTCDPATGQCSSPPVADGTPCDDEDACTVRDACVGGVCRGGHLLSCDDGNPCTDDTCDADTGCVYLHNAGPCDDGNACTEGDVCVAGSCVGGAPLRCDDNNVCTNDTCDRASGCIHTANTAACNDGSACTVNDACAGGRCRGGPPPNCDDGNVCTDDTCEPASGCRHTPNTVPCDDGNACTRDDTCTDGRCRSGPSVDCEDANPCTDDTCNPAEGCIHASNVAPCDDGDACTMDDVCAKGRCAGGRQRVCRDANPCTDDACDPEAGCVFIHNEEPCDDNNACTTNDRCVGGQCTGDPPAHCNDGNPCTDDTCDPASGCVHSNNTMECDDGNACTMNDRCRDGSCARGAPMDCDDANDCTEDDCDPAAGCTHNPSSGPCNDGDLCTRNDTCRNGRCQDTEPVVCTAIDTCHRAGDCDPQTGTCSNPVVEDGIACDDGNACTAGDTCRGGRCTSGTPLRCDDDNPCTDDACDARSGCLHLPNAAPCDDGDLCTRSDRCAEGTCVGSEAVTCVALDPCHAAGRCDPQTGSCDNPPAPDGTACDDGNACTTGEGCAGGRCTGGQPRTCDDGNPCTDDACDASSGCTHHPNTAPCDDGNLCTRRDRCSDSTCIGSDPITCTSRGQCLDAGECEPETGACTSPPAANGTACDDGTACTTEDFCTDGYCIGGPPLGCDDENPCTDDACRAATGCVNTPNAAPCDDGDLCTLRDSCVDGRCAPGHPRDCDDGNACTDDSCDPSSGCSHTRNVAQCPTGHRVAAQPATERRLASTVPVAPRSPDAPVEPVGPVRRTTPASHPDPIATAPSAGKRPPRALARGKVWKIQLAAVRSPSVAEELIARFRHRYVDLVGELDLGIERVDLGPTRGIYYRVQAGAFTDRASAAEVCDALARRDVDCMVVSRN